MQAWEAFYGPNVGYVLELYEQYQSDPNSVDAETRAYFDTVAGQGGLAALTTLARQPTKTPLRSGVDAGTSSNGNRGPIRSGVGSTQGRAGAALADRAVQATPRSGRPQVSISRDIAARVVAAARLARSIREYGHLDAHIDPLDTPRPGDPMLDAATHGITDADLAEMPASIVWPAAGPEAGSCLDAMRALRNIYSGTLGYEFDHVMNYDERSWLHGTVEAGTYRRPLPPERRRALLARLSEVEAFERFLHSVFVGQKRFSIEGTDALVPMLDDLVTNAAATGTAEILIGMAHRGRLNVLAHVLGKPYSAILAEFHHAKVDSHEPSQGSEAINTGWSGDVKYHLGARRTLRDGNLLQIQLTMADNPSHLEFVNPVVEGFARAAQDRRDGPGAPRQDVKSALPVTIHGDAAFPGEGVVAETLNLSRLPGYGTGGTIRIIVNNQIGFTTDPSEARSTLYASDLAKGFEIPIVHVNADDPEACLSAMHLAHAYRERFHRDFLIDLVGYRRWGHNEGDEPGYTQPERYRDIASHPTVRALYADHLVAEGNVTREDADRMLVDVRERLQRARDSAEGQEAAAEDDGVYETPPSRPAVALSVDRLREFNTALLVTPDGFIPHPKLHRQMARRAEALEREGGVDWALAEALAFAGILADGTPIRFTGQDTERGTFSHRHLVLHDAEGRGEVIALQHLPDARASFAVYNSPLTEAATIGFEYGYSVHAPEALVLWEAQFGDFANAGQVLIDQFLAAARAKWRQAPALTLLLPHGYEGGGPEHSSGRIERYLQLAAEDNLRVANCTTAAQYFHLLRLQAGTLSSDRRPLILMTPKSLLRHPAAGSSVHDLAEGTFQPVIDDSASDPTVVERLVLCSGKVYVDVAATRERSGRDEMIAVARVELLYPFPESELSTLIHRYPNVREIVWLQEEPRNMGAWSYMSPRLAPLLPDGVKVRYVGRPERASTAEGSPDAHTREQSRIVEEALGGVEAQIETQGVQQDVS